MGSRQSAFKDTYSPTLANSVLLLLVVWTLFVVPILPMASHRTLYTISFTAVFLVAVAAMQTGRKTILILALITTATQWIARYEDLPALFALSEATNLIFFATVIYHLIAQVARTHQVNARVILESVNGYLLIGLMFSFLVASTVYFLPGSFSFPEPRESAYPVSECVYFSLVTMTTLGYGDGLPRTPLAKSLSTLFAVIGQLYIAVIIATLVGKWAGAMAREPR